MKKRKKEYFNSDLTKENNNIKQNNIKDISNNKDTKFNGKIKK